MIVINFNEVKALHKIMWGICCVVGKCFFGTKVLKSVGVGIRGVWALVVQAHPTPPQIEDHLVCDNYSKYHI